MSDEALSLFDLCAASTQVNPEAVRRVRLELAEIRCQAKRHLDAGVAPEDYVGARSLLIAAETAETLADTLFK